MKTKSKSSRSNTKGNGGKKRVPRSTINKGVRKKTNEDISDHEDHDLIDKLLNSGIDQVIQLGENLKYADEHNIDRIPFDHSTTLATLDWAIKKFPDTRTMVKNEAG